MPSLSNTPASSPPARKEGDIGAGLNLGRSSPVPSQKAALQARYSATTDSKSDRDSIVRIRCLKGLAGPKRFAYHGATFRKSRGPRSSP